MKQIVVAALLAGSTASAFAADLPRKAPPPYIPPQPVYTWTGFHFGVNAGARFGGNSTVTTLGSSLVGDPSFVTVPGPLAFPGLNAAVASGVSNVLYVPQRTGALLGVQAGYDYQFAGAFVAGIEADVQGVISPGRSTAFFNLTPAAIQGAVAPAGFPVTTAGIVQRRTDWLGTVRGRLGYAITPAFLLYATGGLAYGGVSSTTTSLSFANNLPGDPGRLNGAGRGGYSTNRVGYAVGAGGEYFFSPSFSLKAEYLYYNLGSVGYNGGVVQTNFLAPAIAVNAGTYASTAVRTRLRYDGNVARVGVNYHFWGPPVAPVVARY